VFRVSGNSRTFSRRSIHGQVAHEIGMRILRGDYPPDALLPTETTFSSELNISRTAYREAIKVLAAKGLVEPRPKVGTRVRPRARWNMLDPDVLSWAFNAGPNIKHARALFEVRKVIEPAAAAMAAERRSAEDAATIGAAFANMRDAGDDLDARVAADLRFHQAILEATDNELLIPLGYLIESALAQTFRTSAKLPGAPDISIPRHGEVYRAIEEKNPKEAKRIMNQLLDEAQEDFEHVVALADGKSDAA
jgi:DNA-binding FadR family transcriptional regulator